MTATVQAGVRLCDLQQTLHREGQFLALDPPAQATTTVGGTVAANMSGPRRLLYGTARDLVLGIHVVTMDGKQTKAGGRVVKNVTGYDLNKLYIGSLGTLAVLVEVTVKLHPLPPGEATLSIGCAQHTDLLPLLHTIMQLPLRLNSLELLNAAAVDVVTAASGCALPAAAYTLVVRVEGSADVMTRQQQRLTAAVHGLSLTSPLSVYVWPAAEHAALWHSIEDFPYNPVADMAQGVVSKVSLRMSDLPAFVHDVQTLAATRGNSWPILAHAGSGIIYVGIPAVMASAESTALLTAVQALDACVACWQGRRIIVRAPATVKQQCQVWGMPGDDFALMRAIKATFDPHRRLNPGRFIGGL
jgi:glycolate oxidase FAD binding subunit